MNLYFNYKFLLGGRTSPLFFCYGRDVGVGGGNVEGSVSGEDSVFRLGVYLKCILF